MTSEFNVLDAGAPLAEQADGSWRGVVAGDAVTIDCSDPEDERRLARSLLPSEPD